MIAFEQRPTGSVLPVEHNMGVTPEQDWFDTIADLRGYPGDSGVLESALGRLHPGVALSDSSLESVPYGNEGGAYECVPFVDAASGEKTIIPVVVRRNPKNGEQIGSLEGGWSAIGAVPVYDRRGVLVDQQYLAVSPDGSSLKLLNIPATEELTRYYSGLLEHGPKEQEHAPVPDGYRRVTVKVINPDGVSTDEEQVVPDIARQEVLSEANSMLHNLFPLTIHDLVRSYGDARRKKDGEEMTRIVSAIRNVVRETDDEFFRKLNTYAEFVVGNDIPADSTL